MTNQKSVQEVKAAMAAWGEALTAKDIERMHKDYAENYRIFDVGMTVNSVEGVKELWKKCLDFFDEPKAEYKNLVIEASDTMAVAHFNSRITGMNVPMPDEMKNAHVRGTVCFKKVGDTWQCFHEHISFPVNCETNTVVFESDV